MDPRRLLPYLLGLTVCAVLATALFLLFSQRSSTPAAGPPAGAPSPVAGPREVLADWDARRATAWADGDVAALRDLYVAGSPTGRADARMLSAYVERGLRVEGLATQVLALEVINESADSMTVKVTDRLAGGDVVGESVSRRLPRDRATTRTLVLKRVEGVWLVASAQDQASAALSTSRTSTSSKS